MKLSDDDQRASHHAPFVDIDRERIEAERSDERFDRVAFTLMALDRMPPRLAKVAVFESRAGRAVKVDEGLNWAAMSIPETASRRAIVHAVAAIAKSPIPPFSLDTLALPYR